MEPVNRRVIEAKDKNEYSLKFYAPLAQPVWLLGCALLFVLMNKSENDQNNDFIFNNKHICSILNNTYKLCI